MYVSPFHTGLLCSNMYVSPFHTGLLCSNMYVSPFHTGFQDSFSPNEVVQWFRNIGLVERDITLLVGAFAGFEND